MSVRAQRWPVNVPRQRTVAPTKRRPFAKSVPASARRARTRGRLGRRINCDFANSLYFFNVTYVSLSPRAVFSAEREPRERERRDRPRGEINNYCNCTKYKYVKIERERERRRMYIAAIGRCTHDRSCASPLVCRVRVESAE